MSQSTCIFAVHGYATRHTTPNPSLAVPKPPVPTNPSGQKTGEVFQSTLKKLFGI